MPKALQFIREKILVYCIAPLEQDQKLNWCNHQGLSTVFERRWLQGIKHIPILHTLPLSGINTLYNTIIENNLGPANSVEIRNVVITAAEHTTPT